jgi:hypothetical protein
VSPPANTIEIWIEKIAQLFHSLDPFPYLEKDPDDDVEEFIVGWARELPPDKPLRIIVHLPETAASTPEAHRTRCSFRSMIWLSRPSYWARS